MIAAESSSVVATVSLPVGETPVGITSDPVEPYYLVADSSGNVSVINRQSDTYVGNVSGLPSGFSPDTVTFSSSGYAYVADPASHKVVVLQYSSTSPYFTVATTYTGSSSFDPTTITTSSNGATAYVSDAGGTGDIDLFSISSGAFTYSSSISLSYTPATLAWNSNRTSLYVQLTGTTKMAVVTISSGLVSIVSLAVSAGPLAAQNNDGAILVGNASGSSLELVATSNLAELGTVTLAGEATAVLASVQNQLRYFAYVASSGSNNIQVIDLSGDNIRQGVTVGTAPDAITVSPDGSMVYVANSGSSSVTAIQTSTLGNSGGATTTTIPLTSGSDPVSLAITPDGKRLLAVDSAHGEIDVVDTNPADGSSYLTQTSTLYLDGTGTADAALDSGSIALSPSASFGYVVDQGDSGVTVLTLGSSDTYTAATPETGLSLTQAVAIAVSPDGQTAFITDNATNGYLRAYSIAASNGQLTLVSSVEVQTDPVSVALSPEGQTAYVTNAGSSSVSVANVSSPSSMSVSSTTSVPGEPVSVADTPDGTQYVEASQTGCGTGGNSVSVYSGASNGLVSTISVGTTPSAVAVSPMLDTPTPGTLSAGELAGGGNNASEKAVSQGGNDVEAGVNTATGAYTTSVDNFDIPDIGLPLDLSETYDSSREATNGPLGYGWAFSYGMSESQNAWNASSNPCRITVTQEDGSTVYFFPSSSFSGNCPTTGYEAPGWAQATISLVSSCYGSDSCWDVTRDDTTQFLFDQPTGELVFEKDLNGNTVTLNYTSGKLSSVVAASSHRSLSFTWTGSNITKVTDSLGRTASFSYSSGNLTDVVLASPEDPVSHDYHFAYSSSVSHELIDAWSPDNEAAYSGNTAEATEISYNSAGQVTSVVEPDWLTQCTGSAGPPYCAPTTSFTYPSYNSTTLTGTVLVSDPNENDALSDGNITLDTYVDGLLRTETQGYATARTPRRCRSRSATHTPGSPSRRWTATAVSPSRPTTGSATSSSPPIRWAGSRPTTSTTPSTRSSRKPTRRVTSRTTPTTRTATSYRRPILWATSPRTRTTRTAPSAPC